MKNTNNYPVQSWLAAHLYYNDAQEIFLAKAVAPFVEQVMQNGLASQFFFIRYQEKGPHIRLRLKGHPATLEKKVRPALLHHFSNYYAAQPSLRVNPPWLEEVPETQKWFPDNSIQFLDYEPETRRYGGEIGLLIAEQQFQASSQAVLAILQGSNQWEYSRALGVAIQLHLGFAFAAGMDLSEARCFFSKVYESWLPRAYHSYGQNVSGEELATSQSEVLQAFGRAYEKQKHQLLPLFQSIWEGLESQQAFEQEWYNTWLQQLHPVMKALLQAQAQGQLLTPPSFLIQPHHVIPVGKRQRWAIYESYIHMMNNRLGILNRDEGYLAYLIKKGITALALG